MRRRLRRSKLDKPSPFQVLATDFQPTTTQMSASMRLGKDLPIGPTCPRLSAPCGPNDHLTGRLRFEECPTLLDKLLSKCRSARRRVRTKRRTVGRFPNSFHH